MLVRRRVWRVEKQPNGHHNSGGLVYRIVAFVACALRCVVGGLGRVLGGSLAMLCAAETARHSGCKPAIYTSGAHLQAPTTTIYSSTERKRHRTHGNLRSMHSKATDKHSRIPQGAWCDVNGVVRLIERVVVQGVIRRGLYPPLPPAADIRAGARHGAGAGARAVNSLGQNRVPVAEITQARKYQ